MSNTQIWQHKTSGERFAVAERDGEIVGAAGPIHFRDIPLALKEDFECDNDLLDDLLEDESNYVRIDGAALDAALLAAAEDRVNRDPMLDRYSATIFADWDEGAEHLIWAATASRGEIASWAALIERAARDAEAEAERK